MVKDIVIRQRTGQFETLPTCRDRSGVWSRPCEKS
uniref:Uncharacterized protein n=1 Tax=Myoviridae sp. ct5Tq8 TaxID=2826612 RepID=A0A8S5NCI8_9CAUD|nr:MAG TPA: hypothetical protein [Myoviridae sp. ct5Tq8]